MQTSTVCSFKLDAVDVNTGETIELRDSNLAIIAETNISFTSAQLKENHCYYVIITASNYAGSATSANKISKGLSNEIDKSKIVDHCVILISQEASEVLRTIYLNQNISFI